MFDARVSPNRVLHLSQLSDDGVMVADSVGLYHADGGAGRVSLYANGNARNSTSRWGTT